MKVRFWGTRGSIAKAGPSTVRYGGNTSCVEIRSPGGAVIVLDCGTGSHGLGGHLMADGNAAREGHILVSHTHWDHIQGLPFFTPLFVPGNRWTVYGPRGLGPSLRDTMAGQMQYTYFPITPEAFGADVEYRDLVEGSFDIGDVHVTTRYLNHPALTLGYRLEAAGVVVVYATDHEPHLRELAHGGDAPDGSADERHGQFIADADLVIHDAQYTAEEYAGRVGWGHSTMEYVVDLAARASVRNLALFHPDPMRTDDAVDALVARARDRASTRGGLPLFAAAEGRTVELQSPRRPRPRSEAGPSALGLGTRSLAGQTVIAIVRTDALRGALEGVTRADSLHLIEAEDVAATVAATGSTAPSLVLAEACEGLDALELCLALRADHAWVDVPIVVVAPEERLDLDGGQAADVTDWLPWPSSPEYIRSRIRAWVLRTVCRWRRAPRPPEEAARIAALHDLGVLDTEPEERFDRLTRLAAALFSVPFAVVNLVAEERQWSKSCFGGAIGEISRDKSFCAHTILGHGVFQVTDAMHHDDFADNPLVAGAMAVRFYAGVALEVEGHAVGTLCLIDLRPRHLDERAQNLLIDLGYLVERELQPRQAANS